MAQINQPDRPKAFCAKNGCIEKVHGNSSYCKEHAEEGRGAKYIIRSVTLEGYGDDGKAKQTTEYYQAEFNPLPGYHIHSWQLGSLVYILWERDE